MMPQYPIKAQRERDKAVAEGRKTEAEEIDEMGDEEESSRRSESRESRDTRKKSGVQLNSSQTSVSVAFTLILAGIVAKRHWMQNFLQWVRK